MYLFQCFARADTYNSNPRSGFSTGLVSVGCLWVLYVLVKAGLSLLF